MLMDNLLILQIVSLFIFPYYVEGNDLYRHITLSTIACQNNKNSREINGIKNLPSEVNILQCANVCMSITGCKSIAVDSRAEASQCKLFETVEVLPTVQNAFCKVDETTLATLLEKTFKEKKSGHKIFENRVYELTYTLNSSPRKSPTVEVVTKKFTAKKLENTDFWRFHPISKSSGIRSMCLGVNLGWTASYVHCKHAIRYDVNQGVKNNSILCCYVRKLYDTAVRKEQLLQLKPRLGECRQYPSKTLADIIPFTNVD